MSALLWLVTGAALVAAALALVRTRRLAKRLDRLSESYWELKYDHGQLRARVARLEPLDAPPETAGHEVPTHAGPATAFVPLSSLKR